MAICGQRCSVWSRVCGYCRPVITEDIRDGRRGSSWNKGKQAEYKDRLTFSFGKAYETTQRPLPPAKADLSTD